MTALNVIYIFSNCVKNKNESVSCCGLILSMLFSVKAERHYTILTLGSHMKAEKLYFKCSRL